jgi:hypothetical protein
VQSSLNQKQRLQQLFFPEGVRFDGKRIVGTGVTQPVFNYLSPVSESEKGDGGPDLSQMEPPAALVRIDWSVRGRRIIRPLNDLRCS